MYLYTVVAAVIAIAAGVFLAKYTKKALVLSAALCLLLVGCSDSQNNVDGAVVDSDAVVNEHAQTIYPLPDTTMENLSDAILAVSI